MPSLQNVVEVNYEPLMMEINELIDRWIALPLFIIGRIINQYNTKITLFSSKYSPAASIRFFLKTFKIKKKMVEFI